ncbi:MAG: redox protein, partial [Cyanobacteria bacterium J06636_28]
YPFEKFRDTPSVQFFDITVPDSNARDLVFHQGPAISPHSAKTGDWQFYLHPRQEDNLLALSGGRTFYLVNFNWDHPFHRVRLNHNSRILRIPPGTFHRSESDPQGSLVINQAVRLASATVHSEFRVYNSAKIPKLKALLASGLAPMDHGFPEQDEMDDTAIAA